MSPLLKFILDIGPLALFFFAYKAFGLMNATIVLIAFTILALIIGYVVEKRITFMPLFSAGILLFFGGLTLLLKDDTFIKMKPTAVNLLFAAILFGGVWRGKALLKPLLDSTLPLTDEGWRVFSLRWAWFFVFLAGLNEVIWRNFSEDFWVNFKVFGMTTCTVIFTIMQLPLMKRYKPEEPEKI